MSDTWIEPDEYDEHEECAICQDSLGQEQAIFKLSCGHTFHNNCLVNWCEAKQGVITCPLCRVPVDSDVCNSVWSFQENVLDVSSIRNLPHTLSIYKKQIPIDADKVGGNKKRRRKPATKKRNNHKKHRTRKNKKHRTRKNRR